MICCDPNDCSKNIISYHIDAWPNTARPSNGDDVRETTGLFIGQVVDVKDFGTHGVVSVLPIDNYGDKVSSLIIGGTQYWIQSSESHIQAIS